MTKTTVALILAMQVQLACAAPTLIEMAATGESFNPELIQALKPLGKEEINQIRDSQGRSMLHWLAMRSHQARALAVLLAGADANVTDADGRTPLLEAMETSDPVFKGTADLMMVEMLALRGADVNGRTAGGSSPLAIAARNGDYRKAEFLLRRGAIPSPQDVAPERSPLAIAQSKADARMTDLLAAAAKPQGKLPQLPPADQIAKALTAADLTAIARFVDGGWDINERNEKGQTALMRAVEACRPELVTELIFQGADPNVADNNGRTPLMGSLRYLGIEGQRMTAMLLLKGADVHAKTKDGQTALTAAAAAGHDFGVMWLIAAGADPLAPTPKGPLVEYASHSPTAHLLTKFGLPKRKVPPPETDPVALMFAAIRRGNPEGVERELTKGVSASGFDKKSGNALSLAANLGQFAIVDLLIKHGADINEQHPATGWHILHDLAGWGPAQGDPVIAAKHIENLFSRGAKADIQSKDGTTPLMVAAKLGIKEANTEALVKGGASLTIRNKEGLTALGVAKKHGRAEVAEYLQSLGAAE